MPQGVAQGFPRDVGQLHGLVARHPGGGPGVAIPDGSLTGFQHTLDVTAAPADHLIADITVTLDISGGMTGDLYAYLVHGSGFTVLLNRPGRTAAADLGYDDFDGMTVSFRDDAAGDIHGYRADPLVPLGGPLTGTWQPDGRAVHPDQVLDTTARTTALASFLGEDPNGLWTLFLYDASPLDEAVLESWSLTLDLVPVPEPAAMTLAFALAAGGFAAWRGRRRG